MCAKTVVCTLSTNNNEIYVPYKFVCVRHVVTMMLFSGAPPADQRVYGCAALPQALDKYEELMQKFLFAPDDVGEWSFTPKGDLHGLGYSGIDTTGDDGPASEDRTLALYGMTGQVSCSEEM